ncbi:LysR family transcriptional regulator [Streptomyces sp. NPDC005195]|uniref:LysR family transcriptional regulator n=1 Tax=Streptomyces sp. NPDC005195 TaxID=3154561 RepID=UPI0033A81FA5
MNINLAQLRAFTAVLDAGGFGAAGEQLGISQSGVSHTVAAMERELGGPVLVRDRGLPRPTAFGERLLPHARSALAAADAINNLAAQRDGLPSGTVRLGAPPTVCQALLPDLLTRWRQELPRVSVTVFEGQDDEITDWLEAGTLDLAVLVDPSAPPAGSVRVAADAYGALLPADHPLAGEQVVAADELQDDAFLFCGCERYIREAHRRVGVPFRPTHRVRELATLVAMVRSGVGVSIVPGLARALLTPGTVFVPLRPRLTRALVLTGPAARPWHPTAAAVVQACAPIGGCEESPANPVRPRNVPSRRAKTSSRRPTADISSVDINAPGRR